jgi:hypothetical protein
MRKADRSARRFRFSIAIVAFVLAAAAAGCADFSRTSLEASASGFESTGAPFPPK